MTPHYNKVARAEMTAGSIVCPTAGQGVTTTKQTLTHVLESSWEESLKWSGEDADPPSGSLRRPSLDARALSAASAQRAIMGLSDNTYRGVGINCLDVLYI